MTSARYEHAAVDALSRGDGALGARAWGSAGNARMWVPAAIDRVADLAAVTLLRPPGRNRYWFGMTAVCELRPDPSDWRLLEANGDVWPVDPTHHPGGPGFVYTSGTFGFGHGDTSIAVVSGVVGREVTELVLQTGDRERPLQIAPAGCFVALVTGPVGVVPSYRVRCLAAGVQSGELEYSPPPEWG